MNSRTIKRLQRKFFVISMISYLTVIIAVGFFINALNAVFTIRTISSVLSYIAVTEGNEHGAESSSESSTVGGTMRKSDEQVYEGFSSEFRYSVRYFAVVYDADGGVERVSTSHIAAVDREQALAMAKKHADSLLPMGRDEDYLYRYVTLESGRKVFVCLDCSAQLKTMRTLIFSTMGILAVGMFLVLCLVRAFSDRAIEPELENLRRQKQFLTNASHELKTPLAVIRANTEVLEMMEGENEWTQSNLAQVDRMTGLIQNLVMVYRSEEQEDRTEMAAIDVTRAIRQSVDPYDALARQNRVEFTLDLQEGVEMMADESRIRQLASLLIDNAFKYCDEQGKVHVALDTLKKGRLVRLQISNSYADGKDVDYERFFERFYREDSAHTDQEGFGIGLSVAESICRSYGGSIDVSWKDGIITFTCLLEGE